MKNLWVYTCILNHMYILYVTIGFQGLENIVMLQLKYSGWCSEFRGKRFSIRVKTRLIPTKATDSLEVCRFVYSDFRFSEEVGFRIFHCNGIIKSTHNNTYLLRLLRRPILLIYLQVFVKLSS